ncbi:hypothetical protein KFE25_005657 [Diacronema lutheri]|uniref:beta-galactoside alpha-(2,6)-sialyltransferase n=1 Tax=Diacronema lutheri TaxID=2081491 RepID=A0A8J6C938_DIALT|nr:hypothetical protein KFE25_005657 [Diacronema lutheri]
MGVRRALVALGLACAAQRGARARALAECLNASRRLFSDAAQLRARDVRRARAPRAPPRLVGAFDVLEGDAAGCAARVRVNAQYALSKGIQGRASPDVHLDACAWASALRHVRRLPSVLWNGTTPRANSAEWAAAVRAHDRSARGGALDVAVRAYVAYAARAASAGVATPAVAAIGRPRRYGTCAVVGGAPSISAGRRGVEIDAHDAVFRFNDHPAGGRFAPMTGRRTTVRILNAMWAGRQLPPDARAGGDRGGAGGLYVQVCKRETTFEYALRAPLRRVLVEPELLRTFYALFGTGGLTGALGVWLALGWCTSVSLYGFSSPCELGGKYRHYSSALRRRRAYSERVQVNTVKVSLWAHALRCAKLVRWAPSASDGDDGCGAGRDGGNETGDVLV